MPSPQVAVVIPTRNRLPLLREAVGSVLHQRDVEVECVVVDDHSSDGTHEWLETIDDKRLSFVHLETHAERSVARNMGLGCVQSPFVFFLDDDDMLPPDSLWHQATMLLAYPEAVFCAGWHQQVDQRGKKRLLPLPCAGRPLPFLRAATLGLFYPHGLYRTTVVEDVGGWDEGMNVAEDQDLLMRASLQGPLLVVRQITYINRIDTELKVFRDDTIVATDARQRLRRAVDPSLRSTVERHMCARAHLLESFNAYRTGHAFQALLQVAAAAGSDPGALVDPLTRRGVLTFMLRCLLRSVPGSHAAAQAARLTAASRETEPGGT